MVGGGHSAKVNHDAMGCLGVYVRDAGVAGGGHSAKLSHRSEDISGAVANAILVTTRRGELCCAHFAKHVRQQHNLEQVLSSNHSILQEFSNAKVVIFEVPPVTRPRFEFKMLQTVEKLRALGLDNILIRVQPSLRKKSNKALLGKQMEQYARSTFQIWSNLLLPHGWHRAKLPPHVLCG